MIPLTQNLNETARFLSRPIQTEQNRKSVHKEFEPNQNPTF